MFTNKKNNQDTIGEERNYRSVNKFLTENSLRTMSLQVKKDLE